MIKLRKVDCPVCEGKGRILVSEQLYELCLCCWGNRKIYRDEFIEFAMELEEITEDDYFEYVDSLSDSSEHKKLLKSSECFFDWLLERYKGEVKQ